VFNILADRVQDCLFLDLFGGSGAYAIEAISRDAAHAHIIEISRAAFGVIRQNVKSLGMSDKVSLICGDALKAIPRLAAAGISFDIIAVAPPHFASLVDKTMRCLDQNRSILQPDGVVFVQHHPKEPVSASLCNFRPGRRYSYGDTVLSFYSLTPTQ